MIRKAKLLEIPEILSITRACGQDLATQGIEQWNEFYPSESAFKNDITRGELFVLCQKEVLIGVMALSTFMDREYESVAWLSPSGNNLYVHRLAVRPSQQGKGHAQELMSFAETYARKMNFTSIRLDTFSRNARNQRFYETRGYTKLGEVFFPLQSESPFFCYELVLQTETP